MVAPKGRACYGWCQAIQGGVLFACPQDDPQLVKVGCLYLYNGRLCPKIYFCDVFILTIIKDMLADKGLGID